MLHEFCGEDGNRLHNVVLRAKRGRTEALDAQGRDVADDLSRHEVPNVYIDTSAYTAARYPAEIVEYIRGHGRQTVTFGSNHRAWPAPDCLRELDRLRLGEVTGELFLYASAERVFKLKPA